MNYNNGRHLKRVDKQIISEFTALNSRIRQSADDCSSDDNDSVDNRTITNITKRDSIKVNVGEPINHNKTTKISQSRDMTVDNAYKPNSANNNNTNHSNSLRDPQDLIQDALNNIMRYTSQAKAAHENFYKTRTVGSPFLQGPMARPTSNDYMGPWANHDDPVGERRVRPEESRELNIVTRINSVDNEGEGEWIRVRVGVDSCAALRRNSTKHFSTAH